MKQVMNDVAYQNDSRTKAHFPLSHDCNTSLELGYTDPLTCINVPSGNSHFRISPTSNSVVRLDPLVKPTFGRCNLHTFTAFCPNTDLYPYYNEFLSGEYAVTPNGSMLITELPKVSSCYLMAHLLKGSYYQYYERSGRDETQNKYTRPGTSSVVSIINIDANRIKKMFPDVTDNWALYFSQLFGVQASNSNKAKQIRKPGASWSPNSGDIQCCYHDESVNKDIIFSFRLSAKSRRLLKYFNAVGYKPYFNQWKVYNILPLIGFAKCYFDYFRLPNYAIGEVSQHPVYLLYEYFHINPSPFLDVKNDNIEENHFYTLLDVLFEYITNEMWFIEDKNFLSVHSEISADRESNPYDNAKVGIDVPSNGLYTPTKVDSIMAYISRFGSTSRAGTLHALDKEYINQPNLELLKKLYYSCNRQDAIGNDVARILRALGYTEEVDNMKSTYIGSTTKMLNVAEVTNSTDQIDEMPLGDVAGKSVTYTQDDVVFDFDAWTSGYIYTYVSAMPQSGFCNSVPNWLDATDKFSVYNPEFDGFGFEMSDKSVIGTIDCQNLRYLPYSPNNIFGKCPRYLSYKQHSNILNGVFQLASTAESMSPYHFDKLIFNNPFTAIGNESDGWQSNWVDNHTQVPPLPSAGSIWRHPQSSDFLTNYYRIFVDSSNYGGKQHDEGLGVYDKIYFQVPYFCDMFAPLVPIENGYETLEDKQRISKSYTKVSN